ncbi:protein-methionine-sulfoxide reductase heme-binding subunit MsrQ [Methylocapsa polymorpha]|uniref:Protein-methionine-sulfoxide reductase heme-binding subunit MsrQ n=1 Tax=Methylocapsa polymorpha TaxID=3080828 RepID=A0ABZ0HSA2_9HYPH|nr:protein-methionine-sulfoxide reductase heme-binding subunit MsrQ [Methylocapsa sp. RX1]
MWPWTDRAGRFAPLKFATFLGVLVPAVWIAVEAQQGWLGSRPVTEAIHQTGLWAVRLLALTLAVTPLRLASRWSKLIAIRRILGVSVLAYASLHVALYSLDQHFDFAHVASEIALRIYLALGFIGFCGLCALGATSTDGMIARLGAQRWGRLQQLAYPIAVLATVHFFMQSKLDVSEPIVMAGLFSLLFGYRIAQRLSGDLSPWQVASLAAATAFATALAEALWYAFSIRAPLLPVLAANLDFSYSVRPCWFVLGAGVILCVARLLRPLIARAGSAPGSRIRVISARTETP